MTPSDVRYTLVRLDYREEDIRIAEPMTFAEIVDQVVTFDTYVWAVFAAPPVADADTPGTPIYEAVQAERDRRRQIAEDTRASQREADELAQYKRLAAKYGSTP